MIKGQVSVEQLMTYATFISLLIPLTLLFLTFTSLNQSKVDDISLKSSMEDFSLTLERIYSSCSEKRIERKISLRFPDNIKEISIDSFDSNLYLIAELKDGSKVLRSVNIPYSPNLKININPLIKDYRGNKVFYVSCYKQGISDIVIEINKEES